MCLMQEYYENGFTKTNMELAQFFQWSIITPIYLLKYGCLSIITEGVIINIHILLAYKNIAKSRCTLFVINIDILSFLSTFKLVSSLFKVLYCEIEHFIIYTRYIFKYCEIEHYFHIQDISSI